MFAPGTFIMYSPFFLLSLSTNDFLPAPGNILLAGVSSWSFPCSWWAQTSQTHVARPRPEWKVYDGGWILFNQITASAGWLADWLAGWLGWFGWPTALPTESAHSTADSNVKNGENEIIPNRKLLHTRLCTRWLKREESRTEFTSQVVFSPSFNNLSSCVVVKIVHVPGRLTRWTASLRGHRMLVLNVKIFTTFVGWFAPPIFPSVRTTKRTM